MKTKSQKIIYRLKHACLVNCFDLWRDNTQEQIQMKAKSQKIIYRLKHASLVSSFEGDVFGALEELTDDRLEHENAFDLILAVLDNHLHVVLRNRPDIVASWSDETAPDITECPDRLELFREFFPFSVEHPSLELRGGACFIFLLL